MNTINKFRDRLTLAASFAISPPAPFRLREARFIKTDVVPGNGEILLLIASAIVTFAGAFVLAQLAM